MTEQRNLYSNLAFGDGRVGHIQMRNGGEQATKPEDTIVVNELGILMHHGDEHDTITFIPITNVARIRTRAKDGRKGLSPPALVALPPDNDD